MTTLRQAAQQALEALEAGAESWRLIGPAIEALRAALAEEALQRLTDVHQEIEAALEQPEQEPVAYYHPHKGFYWAKPTHISAPTAMDVPPVPLYVKWKAAQRPWQGLTDEEVAIASAEFDTKLKLAFHAGMYKAQIILRKKNDPTY